MSKAALAGETTKTAAKKETTTAGSKGYDKMTVAELKEEAKNKKIEGYTSMKKAELVAALNK